MVQQKISKWENSFGVRLPQEIIQQLKWKEGETVTLYTEGNRLVLSPTGPKYDLEELLAGASPQMQHNELDWAEPVGEEFW